VGKRGEECPAADSRPYSTEEIAVAGLSMSSRIPGAGKILFDKVASKSKLAFMERIARVVVEGAAVAIDEIRLHEKTGRPLGRQKFSRTPGNRLWPAKGGIMIYCPRKSMKSIALIITIIMCLASIASAHINTSNFVNRGKENPPYVSKSGPGEPDTVYILTENFDHVLPTGWEVVDLVESGGAIWHIGASSISSDLLVFRYIYVGSDTYIENGEANTILISPWLNCDDNEICQDNYDIGLSFASEFRTYGELVVGDVMFTIDGINWTGIENYSSDHSIAYTPILDDLTINAAFSPFRVAWKFRNSGNLGIWAIDSVQVVAYKWYDYDDDGDLDDESTDDSNSYDSDDDGKSTDNHNGVCCSF
jgi:hypothetical protein